MRRAGLISCLVVWLTGSCLAGETAWVDVRQVGRFQYFSQFPLDNQRALLEELAGLSLELQRTLALTPSRKPIEVHLLADRDTYRQYVRARVPGGSRQRALFLKGPDRSYIFACRRDDWPSDVRHEAIHALVHNSLPFLPLWLDEGLAEYFEVPLRLRHAGHPHLKRLKWSLLLGRTPSLVRLEARRGFSDLRAIDYRESWAWVHFLMHGPPTARRALRDYLAAIRTGPPPGPFSAWLEKRFPAAETALRKHLRKLQKR